MAVVKQVEIIAKTGEAVKDVKKLNKEVDDTGKKGKAAGTGLKGAFKGFSDAVTGAIPMLGKLKTAMISTGVGALVVALASVAAYFTSTEEGADKLKTVTTFLGIAFEKLKGFIAPLGDALVSLFTNPKESILELWDLIKENIMNRVKGMIDSFQALGTILQGVFELDWEKVKKGAVDYADAAVLAVTGVEDVVGKLKAGFNELAEEVNLAVEAAKSLVAMEEALRKSTNKLVVENAKLNAEIEKQQKTIDDTTLSYDVRSKALDAQNVATERLAINIKNQAIQEENIIKLNLANTADIKEKRELQNDLAQATADRIDAESAVAIVQQDNAQKKREIDLEEIQRIQTNINVIAQLRIDAETNERIRIENEFALAQEQVLIELEAQRATDEQKAEALKLIREQELIALQEYDNEILEQEQAVIDAQDVIAKKKVENERAAARETIEIANTVAEAKEAIEMQNIANAANAVGALATIFDKSKGLQAASLIADSAVGIASIVINTQAANAAAIAKFALLPGGLALAGSQITANKISAGIGIGVNIASTAKALSKLGGGGGTLPTPNLGGNPSGASGGGGFSGGSGGDATPPDTDFGFLEPEANQTTIQAYVVEQNVTNSQQANQLIEDQAAL